jgi:hypothetical protein
LYNSINKAANDAMKNAIAAVANNINHLTGFDFFTAGAGSSTTYKVLKSLEDETAY